MTTMYCPRCHVEMFFDPANAAQHCGNFECEFPYVIREIDILTHGKNKLILMTDHLGLLTIFEFYNKGIEDTGMYDTSPVPSRSVWLQTKTGEFLEMQTIPSSLPYYRYAVPELLDVFSEYRSVASITCTYREFHPTGTYKDGVEVWRER